MASLWVYALIGSSLLSCLSSFPTSPYHYPAYHHGVSPDLNFSPVYHHIRRRDVSNEESESSTSEDRQSRQFRRNDKSFVFYDYLQPPYFGGYVPELPYGYGEDNGNEILARTDPLDPVMRNKSPIPYPDSPIYYIRLPPTPYVFVPGLGYVSQPPPAPMSTQMNPFINVPIDFIANGKPTNIYQWSGAPMQPDYSDVPQYPYPKPKPTQQKPIKPDSNVNTLNKGPYVFNGKPSDVYVLRDSVNALYSDALQNFYP
ncbi:hypothetical protein L9F63_009177 [Diploptera punctata]|uniref:Uncharacterized protein n=1 Tax=Diploptera punctata TaxID=6984 RepID=A0AAD8E1M3_DIPPU|nr:hypothetical protein L9F63_009177 [Diploptera punctata]